MPDGRKALCIKATEAREIPEAPAIGLSTLSRPCFTCGLDPYFFIIWNSYTKENLAKAKRVYWDSCALHRADSPGARKGDQLLGCLERSRARKNALFTFVFYGLWRFLKPNAKGHRNRFQKKKIRTSKLLLRRNGLNQLLLMSGLVSQRGV